MPSNPEKLADIHFRTEKLRITLNIEIFEFVKLNIAQRVKGK